MNYYILLNTPSRESVSILSHGYEKSINVGKNTKETQFVSGCEVSKVLLGMIISFESRKSAPPALQAVSLQSEPPRKSRNV